MRTTLAASALILVAMVAPPVARAQAQPAGWSAFLGCWTPDARGARAQSIQRCVVPGARDGEARFITFSGDSQVVEETMIPDGVPQPMDEKNCTGDQTARWSKTGVRFFYRSTSTCAGGPPVATSGISTLVTADQWLDVQSALAGGREQARVIRYWRSTSAPPAPIADQIRAFHAAPSAVPPVTVDAIVEASNEASVGPVEAWLAESAAHMPIDRRTLVRLGDAHVNPRVIDLLVAQAFPKKFEVRAGGSSSSSSVGSLFFDDQWFGASLAPDFYGVGYGVFGTPFYFGWGQGYRPYDFVGTINQTGSGGSAAVPESHGRVVNGQGYTQVQPREPVATVNRANAQSGGGTYGGAGTDSSGSGSGSSSGSGGGGSDSGVSPAGYSGGGGTSTGLTAVPR
jgi:hypothetical protein